MKEKETVVASDFTAIEPVFYMLTENGVHTSPDITELIREKGRSAVINQDALKMYLVFQYVPTCETIVKGIYRLAPGSTLRYSAENGLTIEKHPHPVFAPDAKDSEQSAAAIRSAVVASVNGSKPVGEKLGCFLSGGIDSSLLAYILKPDFTYTFAFDRPDCDESEEARQLSNLLGAENRCLRLSADDFFGAISELQRIMGQPYANLTGVPVYFLAKLASREVHTVFSGEGPDELFGGYDNYKVCLAEKIYRKFPLAFRRMIAKLCSDSDDRFVSHFLRECALSVEESYIGQAQIMTDQEAESLLQVEYRSKITHRAVTAPFFEQICGGTDLDKKQYLDLNLWGPFDNVLNLYLVCRHFGLDVRTPFMSETVTQAGLSLKGEYRAKGMKTKIAFRQAASSFLPPENCRRPKKGMPLPYGTWLRDEKYLKLIRDTFSEPYAKEFFDPKKLNKMLEDHIGGRADNARKLYTIYCFLLWYREFLALSGRS